MKKQIREVNPSHLTLSGVAIIMTLWATTAWSQEEALNTTDSAGTVEVEEAAAPVELPPPGRTDEESGTADDEALAPEEDLEAHTDGDAPAPMAEEEPGDEEPSDEEPSEQEDEDAPDDQYGGTPRYFQFGHRLQGGLAFLLGTGYAFEIAYGGDNCYSEDDADASVCNRQAPFFFDFIGSFGVTDGLEVLLEYRLGLINQSVVADDGVSIATSRPMAFGFGIRYYVSSLSRFKFNIGAIIDIDFTKSLKTDVYIRPIFGLQIEIVRWVGFFIQASVNMSFIRVFGITLEGGGGLQFRFP
jgi:hypothetical protein